MGITSIDADGWQAVYPSVPTGPVLEEDIAATRAGFTSAGAATSFSETLKLTRRIRRHYPNQVSLTADKVALSDFVYSTDTVAGVVNNSTLLSPRPIAKWVSLDRDVVGNSVSPELVAFHRDGVAYVEFRATDGVITVTAGTSSQIVLGAATDRNAVLGYRATLDLTSLGEGLITVHAKVWPRLGSTGSVRDSTDVSARREFSARYYRKDVALAAAPYYVYVAVSGGNDTTGAVSTTAATAEASPVATVAGALQRINAVVGAVDGCIIRFMAGTHTLTSPGANRTQNIAAVTLTRDPNAAKSAVILQAGTTWFAPRLATGVNATVGTGCLRVQGVTLDRIGSSFVFNWTSPVHLEVQLVDAVVDLNGVSAALLSNASAWWFGCEIQASHNSAIVPGATVFQAMFRGCFGTMGHTNIDGYCVVGCDFNEMPQLRPGATRTGNGQVVAFNKFIWASSLSVGPFSPNSNTSNIEGVAYVQNLVECLPNTSLTMLIPSADGATYNLSHFVCLHNTFTGFNGAGRSNILYDETAGLQRQTTLNRVAGNIQCQLNTKHDIFAADGTHVGCWSYLYGVGCDGEFSQYEDAGTFEQEYPGPGANIGTSSTVRNDPLFVDYRGATGAGAGAGGGDYTLQAGSPAIGALSREWLGFDLAGRRRTRKVSGALEPDLPLPFQLFPRACGHLAASQAARLSPDYRVNPANGRLAAGDTAIGLGVAQVARAVADGRVLRVDGDTRTLWARRD